MKNAFDFPNILLIVHKSPVSEEQPREAKIKARIRGFSVCELLLICAEIRKTGFFYYWDLKNLESNICATALSLLNGVGLLPEHCDCDWPCSSWSENMTFEFDFFEMFSTAICLKLSETSDILYLTSFKNQDIQHIYL